MAHMNKVSIGVRERDESPSAAEWSFKDNPSMFQLLFERSADAILLFDPKTNVFVDCNAAAVDLMRANSKEQLLGARPEDLSPPFQADGTPTAEKSAQITALVEERGGHRFEWVARRFDGHEVPLEVLVTPSNRWPEAERDGFARYYQSQEDGSRTSRQRAEVSRTFRGQC